MRDLARSDGVLRVSALNVIGLLYLPRSTYLFQGRVDKLSRNIFLYEMRNALINGTENRRFKSFIRETYNLYLYIFPKSHSFTHIIKIFLSEAFCKNIRDKQIVSLNISKYCENIPSSRCSQFNKKAELLS